MSQMAQKLQPTQKRQIRSAYFHYLIPTIVGQVAHCCYVMADVFFVGAAVGKNGLAALNVALPIFTVYSTFGILIGVGAATTISVCRGEGNHDAIDRVFTQALLAVLLFGALSSVFGTIFLRQIAYLFGATDLIAGLVVEYLSSISMLSFIYVLSAMLTVVVRSDGDPRLVMAAGITGNIMNITLDYVFVNRMGMGMFGAGLATIIGPMFTVSLLSLHFLLHRSHVRLTKNFFSPALLWRTVKNGLGAGVLETSAGLVILMFNVALIRVSGETAVAVFSVISNIAYIGKSVFNGMSQAAQPIISESYGAKDFIRSSFTNRLAMQTAFLFALAVGVIVSLVPGPLVGFFVGNDPASVEMGRLAVPLYFLSFPLTGLNTVLMYYFQSMERVRHTLAISVLRGVVLTALTLLVLSYLFGLNGVWISLFVTEGFTFVMFYPVKLKMERRQRLSVGENGAQ